MDIRYSAFQILYKIIDDGAYSNITLNNVIMRHNFTSSERRFLTNLVYGTLENKISSDYIIDKYYTHSIKKMPKRMKLILEMAIYQIRFMNSVPDYAVTYESVNLAKKIQKNGRGYVVVNAVLRAFLSDENRLSFDFKTVFEQKSFEFSIPVFMVKAIITQYGEKNAELLFESFLKKPEFYIRINRRLTNREEMMRKIISAGYEVFEVEEPYILKLSNIENIIYTKFYKDGLFSIQDINSYRCATFLGAGEEDLILDACAGLGGKSLSIAEITGKPSNIYCSDLHYKKSNQLFLNAERLKLTGIKYFNRDGTEYYEPWRDKFDKVLLDVPCSGWGVIRHKPEIRFQDSADIQSIIRLQEKLISNVSKYVKPGGKLLYTTCTFNKEENEEQIAKFLLKNPNFIIDESCGMRTMLPSENEGDGFFAVGLKKHKECV